MAICDARYKFTFVGIGHYRKDDDASIFGQSDVGWGQISIFQACYIQPRELTRDNNTILISR